MKTQPGFWMAINLYNLINLFKAPLEFHDEEFALAIKQMVTKMYAIFLN